MAPRYRLQTTESALRLDQAVYCLGVFCSESKGRRVTLPGYRDQGAAVQRRLTRIEDRVRGLQPFVSEDRCCGNTLEEISVTTRAIHSVAMKFLANHLSRCVKEAWARRESEVKVKEAQVAIERLVQS